MLSLGPWSLWLVPPTGRVHRLEIGYWDVVDVIWGGADLLVEIEA